MATEKSQDAGLVAKVAARSDMAVRQLCKTMERHGCVARAFDRAEDEVNHS